VLEHINYTP